MRTIALLVASAAAYTELSSVERQFMTYIVEHGKSYGTKEEYEARLDLFAQAHKDIAALNSMNGSATCGHNMFSDMTSTEKKSFLGYNGPQELNGEASFQGMPTASSVDWRTEGGVNAVKNQAHCGSCWAFSAVAAIEHAHWRTTGDLESYSEQQIVSCDTNCYGCQGGLQSYAFQYVESNGLSTEADYPYTSSTGRTGTCDSSKTGSLNVQSY